MLGQRHRQWIAAVNSTDIDAYAQLVTDDLVWIPPGAEPVVGRAAFRSWLEPFFNRFTYETVIENVKAHESEAWIAETGTVTSHMAPRAGGPGGSHDSRYFVLWRREWTEWKINRYVDMANLQ
jgi:uncharacterized protein (TIGR02246 family)